MKLLNLLVCFILLLSGTVLAQKKVKVNATPVDAIIFDINPATKELRQIGIGTAVIAVPKNSSTTIVLQKAEIPKLENPVKQSTLYRSTLSI